MRKYRELIIQRRDQTLSDGPPSRTAFVLYMDHSTIPPAIPTWTYATFRRYLGANVVHYKSRTADVLAPRAVGAPQSTLVELRVGIPYGERRMIIPFQSAVACSLFGWNHLPQIEAGAPDTLSAESEVKTARDGQGDGQLNE